MVELPSGPTAPRGAARGPAAPRRVLLLVVLGALVLGVAAGVPGYYYLRRPAPPPTPTPVRPPTAPPTPTRPVEPPPIPTPTVRAAPLTEAERRAVAEFDVLLGRYVALRDQADARPGALDQVTAADAETVRRLVAVLEELDRQAAGLPLGAPERQLFREAIRARLEHRQAEVDFMQRTLGGGPPSAEEIANWFKARNRSAARIRGHPRYRRLDRQLEKLGFAENRADQLLPD